MTCGYFARECQPRPLSVAAKGVINPKRRRVFFSCHLTTPSPDARSKSRSATPLHVVSWYTIYDCLCETKSLIYNRGPWLCCRLRQTLCCKLRNPGRNVSALG